MSLTASENRLTLGFSPCPNDTFIFDALVNGKIDTHGLKFEQKLEDVESLNHHAIEGRYDITKLSFFALGKVLDSYELLPSGSAVGRGVGPLLISKKTFTNPKKEIRTVAIPGINTTAYFLFRIFYPELKEVKEMVFSDIEEAVLSGVVDAGVIIHENRFTYQAKGLKKISDLGDLWENITGKPIPLGGIAIKKNLSAEIKIKVGTLIRESVEFAFAHPKSSFEYVKANAQEMSEEVRNKHIDLYVNKYSIDLGTEGNEAVQTLFAKAKASGIL